MIRVRLNSLYNFFFKKLIFSHTKLSILIRTMDFVCDDIKGEILQAHPSNNYRLSMVSKEWYHFIKPRIVNYYKDFKELCKSNDMLSIVRSRHNIHSTIITYYSYAFANDEIVRFATTSQNGANLTYALMGACRGGHEIRTRRLLKKKLPFNKYLLFYAAKGQNMKIINMLSDTEYIRQRGLYGACYVGNM